MNLHEIWSLQEQLQEFLDSCLLKKQGLEGTNPAENINFGIVLVSSSTTEQLVENFVFFSLHFSKFRLFLQPGQLSGVQTSAWEGFF